MQVAGRNRAPSFTRRLVLIDMNRWTTRVGWNEDIVVFIDGLACYDARWLIKAVN